jgi:predicted fused transcriptional regulator/phosphomethylpyrimidine kinase/predicted transcriptional regulator
MKFPCELITEPYITEIRITITKILKEKGYSQNQISDFLQVSQPIVSGYLRKDKLYDDVPNEIVHSAKTVGAEIAELLMIKGKSGIPESISMACYQCKMLRTGGPVCLYHKHIIPSLEEDCTRCLSGKDVISLQVDKTRILSNLRMVYYEITNLKNIERIIPEIGMQIVLGGSDMNSTMDIAGFPSRIIKRKKSNLMADGPIFGGSSSLSDLLLLLNNKSSNIFALASIKTSEWLTKRLTNLEKRFEVIDGFDLEYRRKIDEIIQISQLPLVIIDHGSLGYEAISYILSSNHNELIKLMREIVNY